MTRPRTDAHRLAIVQRSRTVLDPLGTAPHTVSHLRARIAAARIDGLAAAAYDGDGGVGGGGSPVERLVTREHDGRIVGRPTRADRDLEDLDHALDLLDLAERILTRLVGDYPHRDRPASQLRPGIDPCPPGHCVDHWAAGQPPVAVAKGRYRRWCRPCGVFRERHGRPRTAPEIRHNLAADGRPIPERPPRPTDGHGAVTA